MLKSLTGVRRAVVLALVTAGCSGAGADRRGPVALGPSSATSGYGAIWVNSDRQPIGQLRALGSVMVGMAVDDFKLFLIAMDPATGRELWHQQMGHSIVTPGEPVDIVLLDDDRVAYLRPSGDKPAHAQLVIADAHTGADVATSAPAMFTSWPYACADRKAACAIGHGNPGGREHEYRLDVATDDFSEDSEGLPPGARILESDGELLDLGDRPGNTLAWLHGGAIAWRTRAEAAFPPGFSSDHGWTWHRFADEGVFVGSLYGAPMSSGVAFVHDLAHESATAGLRVTTGEVAWRDAGSSLQCRLPDNDHPVRCRVRGFLTSRSETITFDQLDVTVEGFDVSTGKTTWSIPLGASESLVRPQSEIPIAGPARIVVRAASGPVILDYAAGRVSPLESGAKLWCMSPVRYHALPAFTSPWDGTRQTERPGGNVAAICDAQGRPATELPGPDATLAVGAHVGHYAVIAARNGYVGFRIH